MTRAVALGLVLIAVAFVGRAYTQTADASDREQGWRQEQCRFASRDGQRGWSTGEVRSTLRCAADRWHADLDLAMRIVGCESGFHADAQNPYSSAAGVWQALEDTFAGWVDRAPELMDRWEMRDAQLNGRTNGVLGFRVLATAGTGPWEASRSCWG